jgi:NAD+ kinase
VTGRFTKSTYHHHRTSASALSRFILEFFFQITPNAEARTSSYVCFDGRHHQELKPGDSLRVTTSIYPVPSICAQDQISDWFDSLAECLHWNVRKRQKHLDELTDLTHSSSNDTLDSLDPADLIEKDS